MGLNYIARCRSCHRVCCIASERLVQDDPKYLAKNLSQWVRWGFSVERMTTEDFRAMPNDDFGHTDDCPEEPSNARRAKRRAAAAKRQPNLF